MTRDRALVLLWAVLPSVAACAIDLPLSERIINVRPLGVRVEVAGATADLAVRAEALPTERITAIPFIVDDTEPLSPERIEQDLEPVWLACPLQPIQGVFSCLSSQLPLQLDEIEDCPGIDFGALDPESGELPAVPTPCRLTGGTPAAPQMQVPLDFNLFIGGDLELTMIGHRPDGGTTERCAQALLGQEPIPGECLTLVQRASVGPNAAILQLVASYGIFDTDALGPVPEDDQIPDADRNPRIQTFRVVVTDEEDIAADDFERIINEGEILDVARGDTLTVAAGQTLVIETTALEEDLQLYPIPASENEDEPDAWMCAQEYRVDGFEGFGPGTECRVEVYEGDWYRTWGTLLANDSDDPVSYNTWTMVPGEQDDALVDTPPDDRATLYYVLRDDRQGVDWWWFHVQVQ